MFRNLFIFDLDGVLTDTADYHFIAWQAIATQLNISFNETDNEALKGIDRVNSLTWLLNKANKTVSTEQFEQLLIQKNSHYNQLINTMSSADLFDGVIDLFHQLQVRNSLIGLASASKNAHAVINKLGISHYFDFIADANTIKHNKPAPDIFLTVANQLHIPAHRCVGIEDSVAGIDAINSAGMYAVGIGQASVLTQAKQVYTTTKAINLDAVINAIN